LSLHWRGPGSGSIQRNVDATIPTFAGASEVFKRIVSLEPLISDEIGGGSFFSYPLVIDELTILFNSESDDFLTFQAFLVDITAPDLHDECFVTVPTREVNVMGVFLPRLDSFEPLEHDCARGPTFDCVSPIVEVEAESRESV
jgi:hypothetical protein